MMRRIFTGLTAAAILLVCGCGSKAKSDGPDREGRVADWRNTSRHNELSYSQTPATRPAGSIEAGVLVVSGENLTADEVIRRARPELERLARTFDEQGFRERVGMSVFNTLRDLVSEVMLYKQIANRLTEEQDPLLEKAVNKAVEEMVAREAGGSTVRFEKLLIARDSNMDALRSQLRRQILNQQYLREQIRPKVVVTREELWHYYQTHQPKFQHPARAHVLLIEVDPAALAAASSQPADMAALAQQRLAEIQRRLDAGEDFRTVAADLSTGSLRKLSGDIGWITQGSHRHQEIDERAFAQPIGLPGEPVAIGRRFYFVLVEQRENARQVPFADAQDEIRPILERERYIQLVNDHVTDLWRKAAVGPVEPFMRTVLSRMPTYEALRTNPLLSAAATPDGPATNGVEPLP